MPDRIKLAPMVSVFRGFIEDPGFTDSTRAVRLHELLLKEALAALPKTVRRLILIPDGPLHHLPFSALKASPDAPPLGRTHELLVVPSASVWVRRRQQTSPSTFGGALILADPSLNRGTVGSAVAAERGWPLEAMPAGSLPHARVEGRSVMASMPGPNRLLEGAAASEVSLKQADLSTFGVLHFATHALVDEAHPDRSAVLLAGAATEDGLLQAREIVDLQLRGSVVVLSACRSATGAVLAGEGVLGLARSFLEAGARTVIGTLWPIRDDDAAMFVGFFYEYFGRGQTIGAALRSARLRAIDAGLPASVWSSFVAIGNDDVVVVREAERAGAADGYFVGTVLIATVVALLWWSRSNHRRAVR